MSVPVLTCENLSLRDKGIEVFSGVSLSLEIGQGGLVTADPVKKGRMLLEICAGAAEPTSGRVRWFDQWGNPPGPRELQDLRWSIGRVHRGTKLVSSMTILDNITIGLLYHRNCTQAEAYAEVRGLMDRLGLQGYRNLRPAELSQDKLRLAVYAREMAKKPKLFLFETPSVDLEHDFERIMLEVWEAMKRKETAFLFTDQSDPRTTKWVDWVLEMDAEASRLTRLLNGGLPEGGRRS